MLPEMLNIMEYVDNVTQIFNQGVDRNVIQMFRL